VGAQEPLGLGLLLLRGVLLVLSFVLLVSGHVFVYDSVKLVGESCATSAAGGGGGACPLPNHSILVALSVDVAAIAMIAGAYSPQA
jgi:hypothetical protein